MSKLDLIVEVSGKAFEVEQGRGERLADKAEKYVGAVAVIIGFQLISLDDLHLTGKWREVFQSWVTLGAFSVLMLALGLALWSRRVFDHPSFPNREDIFDNLGNREVTSEAAKMLVAQMYWDIRDGNIVINDRRAKFLSLSGNLIVAGLVLVVLSYLVPTVV